MTDTSTTMNGPPASPSRSSVLTIPGETFRIACNAYAAAGAEVVHSALRAALTAALPTLVQANAPVVTAGGRPVIGTPVSVTLPDLVLREVEDLAEEDGVTRAEELRLVVVAGLSSRRRTVKTGPPVKPDTAAARRLREELRPATDRIVAWIAADPELTRARLVAYRRTANYAPQLVQLLLDATREDVDAGRQQAPLSDDLIARLSAPDDWRIRGQLFFAVVAELSARGDEIPPARPDDPDDEPGDPDEDYSPPKENRS